MCVCVCVCVYMCLNSPYPHTRIQFKKSGSSTPRVELEEMGPSLDLMLRRVRLAAPDLYRLACKTPKQLKVSSGARGMLFISQINVLHLEFVTCVHVQQTYLQITEYVHY